MIAKNCLKTRIRESGLFDEVWYLRKYLDVSSSGLDPLDHYVRIGVKLNRSPNPLFDAKYYRRTAGLLAHEAGPLLHYLEQPHARKSDPHPLFAARWYIETNKDLQSAGVEPLRHFLHQGAVEGRQPHPCFPTAKVLLRYPGLKASKRTAVEFYLSGEWTEDPCPEATLYLASLEDSEAIAGRVSPALGLSKAKQTWPRLRIPKERPQPGTSISTDIRTIAIYLPQFHAIPENDEWWGPGFTEWTNVRRGLPLYDNHYQPHIPHPDVGYYDLSDEQVLERQAAMAREAGIEGFCFYYYWFNGRRLLNMPTDRLLATGKPDFPFCFCWANENWTRTWDGGDREILIAQDHSPESDERFILDLLPAFRDPRYIRVGGKPLLIVYRPGLLPKPAATARHWRDVCRREGIGEIFLARMQMFDWELHGKETGFDTVIQFPLVSRGFSGNLRESTPLNAPETFSGYIYDYRLSACRYAFEEIGETLWPGVCPSWDNTARRMERGSSWTHSSPENYYRWLKTSAQRAKTLLPAEERFLFVNAWNEWAEGCHLEPDEKHGYAWLNATRLALSNAPSPKRLRVLVVGHDAARAGAQIVLLNMLREWNAQCLCEARLVLLEDGVLRREFETVCETLVLSDFSTKAQQKRALENFSLPAPDIVLGNTAVIGSFLPTLKHLGVPIVAYIHELQKSIERWAPGAIMRSTVENSDHFIAVSPPVADNLHRTHGVPTEKISILNPYIETSHRVSPERLVALRAELGIQPHEKIVFGCGTMDWRKGPDLFVHVANQVLRHVPQARFVWIGWDIGDESSVRARALAESPRISFLGERSDPRSYFPLGAAFFLSSREDPYPLVALEAADAGLPIVCFSEAGGMPTFVGDECGCTVPLEDTEAATATLVDLLTDEDRRQRLGRAGQAKVCARHDAAQGSKAVHEILQTAHHAAAQRAADLRTTRAEPFVSVILPNYNHAKFLPERLASIAGQTHRNLEIILLDDHSTDESLGLLRDFVARDPRARLVANTVNSGSTFKQWRKGLAEAKGRYIWIAESDDSAHPELLATLVDRLESNGQATLAACCPRMTDLEGKDLGIPKEWFADIGGARWESDFSSSGRREIADVMTRKNAILNASGVLFRNAPDLRDLVDESMRLCADWLFWIRLLGRGDFEYVARPLNYWRLASSNARTEPPGKTEWLEGSRVLREVSLILAPNCPGESRLLDRFRERCDGWKAKHEERSLPVSANGAEKAAGVFLQREGWCPICEKKVTFSSKQAWLRDHYLCSGCGSIPRERAIMHVIQTRYPNWRELRVHESSPGHRGASVKLREQCRHYTATQYDPALGFGRTHPNLGYRSEDLEKQTFDNEKFHLVVTQDVMEHIFDAEAAFREIHRTLKPGGAHIFTTPLVNKNKPSQRHAERKPNGTVVHLFPAEFHGNPISSEGSLVTWHWGFDITERIDNTYSSEVGLIDPTDSNMGIEAEYIEVVIQKKH